MFAEMYLTHHGGRAVFQRHGRHLSSVKPSRLLVVISAQTRARGKTRNNQEQLMFLFLPFPCRSPSPVTLTVVSRRTVTSTAPPRGRPPPRLAGCCPPVHHAPPSGWASCRFAVLPPAADVERAASTCGRSRRRRRGASATSPGAPATVVFRGSFDASS